MGRATGIVVAAFVAATLTACGSSSDDTVTDTTTAPVDKAALVGTYVSTAGVREQGTAFSSPVTVGIEGSHVNWQARCNSAGGPAAITTDQLIVADEKVASTAMGCEKSAEQQDEDLAAFFASDPQWSLDGRRLTLTSGTSEASKDFVEVALQRDATPPDS